MLPKLIKKATSPTHAGGVVYRQHNGTTEYLLVSARRFAFIWMLPKGRIKLTEPEEKAALREVKEESGLKAYIRHKIGNSRRLKWNLRWQVVAFYLMEFIQQTSANRENRKTAWLPLDKAINKLFYGTQKNILLKLKGHG